VKDFLKALSVQRWDDHRYYHQCRINQSLHFISALSFLVAYVMVFVDPPVAGLIGWLVSMVTRQSGHFFFEPTGYDHINQATQEHKEAIKVGYNLQRKIVLIAVWVAVPLALLASPTLFGLVPAAGSTAELVRQVGWGWLLLGVAGLLFRMLQLFVLKGVQTGLVWVTKILTDPFHDVWLYHRAPLQLLKGQRYEQPQAMQA